MKPGDVLLYRPADVVGWVVALKGLSRYAHVEVYAGRGYTFASRPGLGVGVYDVKPGYHAYRLHEGYGLNWRDCEAWFFAEAFGQGYDMGGVLLNPWAVFHGRENGKQFCSELAGRLLRNGCVPPTDPFYGRDADGLHPADFARPPFTRVV